MKTTISTLTAILFAIQISFAQSYTISGYVFDAESGESLISATIYLPDEGEGTVSNIYGFYSLTHKAGPKTLDFSYIGYETKSVVLDLQQDTSFNIYLGSSVTLDEVEIIAERDADAPTNVQMSQVNVSVAQIKKTPMLLGEVDVIKAIQLLPGVQSGSEGFNGLYVRGGSPDQNLVILDGVPVYNISHLFGIFSVFNADALKNVTLIKGGFPAQYGGRLSSVLDIRMKEGNLKKFEGEGSIGAISSKLTLQGPIVSDKTSFLISGRRTYADLIAKPFIKRANRNNESQVDPTLYFYDFNAKLQHVINDSHRLFLSGYFGQDKFNFKLTEDELESAGGINWGNKIGALRWNWKLSDRLFANTTLTYSNYDLDINSSFKDVEANRTTEFSSKYISAIEDYAARFDLDFIPNPNNYIKFGGGAINHSYDPGAITLNFVAEQTNIDTLLGTTNQKSTEMYAYLQDEITLGKLKANIGLHFSAFDVDDTFYTSLQPRIGLRYLVNQDLSFKASYTQMAQYINLLTSESLLLPTDLWVPSTARIKPQTSWQAAAGISATVRENYNLTVEGFYKKMDNVLSFNEGASFLAALDGDWQSKVSQGVGEAYGAEVLLQKKEGKLTGWVGYTLSWNTRQFDNINFGNKYPFRYDRRHDLSVVLSYDLNDRISFSGNWVYGTGNAVTLPIYDVPTEVYRYGNGQEVVGEDFNSYSGINEKNSFRMSNFHRMDLGVSFHKKKKWGERTWVISVYNAYAHNNPFYISLDTDYEFNEVTQQGVETRTFKEIAILPLIPSVAYNFKF